MRDQCFEHPGQMPAVSNVFQQCWQPGEQSQRSDFCGRQRHRGQRIFRKSGVKRRVSIVGARLSLKNVRPNEGSRNTIRRLSRFNSQFPIPNSQSPIPNPQFPIPNSQFPIPNSQFPIPCPRGRPSIQVGCKISGRPGRRPRSRTDRMRSTAAQRFGQSRVRTGSNSGIAPCRGSRGRQTRGEGRAATACRLPRRHASARPLHAFPRDRWWNFVAALELPERHLVSALLQRAHDRTAAAFDRQDPICRSV